MKRDVAGSGLPLAIVSERCTARSVYLPAAPPTARTKWSTRVNGGVTELARSTSVARDKVAVGKNARSHTLRDGHKNNVSNPIKPAKREFRDHAGIRGIFHLHRQPHLRFDGALQVEVGPVKIGSENQALRFRIHAAWKTDADSLN